MTAEEIANVLRGRKSGNGFIACCPAHEDHQPSLSIRQGRDGRALVHCHAGCEQRQVISALESRGLWDRHGQQSSGCSASAFVSRRDLHHEDTEQTERALSIWKSAAPAEGTLVETYLASRGLAIPPRSALRFHAGLRHPSGIVAPSMVALVTVGSRGTPRAVHRTFLARNGEGKIQLVPARMMLGPCNGGAVRLTDIQKDRWLVIAEGIETTLAVMQACSLPGWAALSAGGIRNLILPPEATMVLICADNDERDIGQSAAYAAAHRFVAEGRQVRVAIPPEPGTDFNDVLVRGATVPVGDVRHVA